MTSYYHPLLLRYCALTASFSFFLPEQIVKTLPQYPADGTAQPDRGIVFSLLDRIYRLSGNPHGLSQLLLCHILLGTCYFDRDIPCNLPPPLSKTGYHIAVFVSIIFYFLSDWRLSVPQMFRSILNDNTEFRVAHF